MPGGDGTVGAHRGIEVVRGAPRDGPVGRDSYLVAHIEPDGLPVEFRCILLFAPCRSGSAACTVEVQPRYDTFEEPLYELFGQPLSVLKEAETREILEENDTAIFYKGERPYIAKVQYRFDKGEDPVVFYANIFIEKSYKEEMRNFFFERYEYDGSNDCFYNFRSIPPIMIAFDETEPEYIVVTYFQTHKL